MKKVLAGILVLIIAGVCFLNILGDGQQGQKEQHYIVLGDGRAADLIPFACDEDKIEFITKSGADLEWLVGEALPELMESDRKFSCVIIMTGISDMQNAGEYVTALNEWGKRLKEERDADHEQAEIGHQAPDDLDLRGGRAGGAPPERDRKERDAGHDVERRLPE